MKIEAVDLRRISIPMIAPFRVSFGVEHQRDILLARVVAGDAEGWGECVAMSRPLYSPEYVDGAEDVMRRHLLPRLFDAGDVAADQVGEILRPIHGHPMAKAALEIAGLMTVGRLVASPEAARSTFAGLRELSERLLRRIRLRKRAEANTNDDYAA